MKLDTPEDRISAYMINKIDETALHKTDFKLMNRWLSIWRLLLSYHSPNQAVEAHMKACKLAGEEISIRTSWYDLKHATKIWGNMQDISYQATLVLLKEYAMQTFQLAIEEKALKEMNRSISELREISKELHRINGDEDPENEQNNFILVVNQSDGGRVTIDLTDYEVMPDDLSKTIIEAVQQNQNSAESFLKLVEKGAGKDEE